ncbi:hypothetical protein [Paenibacillus sp.]|uniref:hypothetical protein n=1 Tax=Paenibacillus sp. TaxID=58172 RepID=UPI0028A6882C|nr:hypothetical protein [Paenibacillus sp.]
MPKSISEEQARELGIEVVHQLMDNGERRFRLVSSDGSSYIRTEASSEGSWQNSHFHKELTEFYLVQSGWLVYAELSSDDELIIRYMKQGDSILVLPLIHHNLYMSPYTVTHVIKYGNNGEQPDWFSSPELDKQTKNIPESDLIRMIGTTF